MDTITIDRLTGKQFERLLEKILPKIEFENIERTIQTGDFGADLIATRNGKKFVIQVKRYSRPVGNKAVQEVFASMPVYEEIKNNYLIRKRLICFNLFYFAVLDMLKQTILFLHLSFKFDRKPAGNHR